MTTSGKQGEGTAGYCPCLNYSVTQMKAVCQHINEKLRINNWLISIASDFKLFSCGCYNIFSTLFIDSGPTRVFVWSDITLPHITPSRSRRVHFVLCDHSTIRDLQCSKHFTMKRSSRTKKQNFKHKTWNKVIMKVYLICNSNLKNDFLKSE